MLTHAIMQELDNFVDGNQTNVTEVLEDSSLNLDPEKREVLEVLQQSLFAAGILVRMYRKSPRAMLYLINKMLK